MIRYIIRKVGSWLVLVFLAVNMTYFMASAFLDPTSNYSERRPPIPPEQIQRYLEPMYLSDNQPLLTKWWHWLTSILTKWDWGEGFVGTGVVNEEIANRAVVSAQLLLGATIIAVALGVALGVYTASRQYKLVDRVIMGFSVVCMNLHTAVVSVVIVMFGVWLNKTTGTTVFYVTGAAGGDVSFLEFLQRVTLPTLSLVIINYASYHITQRSLLLDNIDQDYVRTARAKGLTRNQAIRKHAFRTSLIPIATSVAFAIPGIFTGAVVTESIYAWRGMGQYLVQTIAKNDIHGAVATAAFSAVLTAVGAILSDIFIVIADPRVRVS
ncbi:peptide/nickel transport system permease protein [Actinobaculum suis]|uniref:ABC transporter permease n=1 Tax=Actinobaculum suis TaxID=1657 RepID=A0A0K9EVH4_9ACTO|nr:ABC transporter permease [Actinobaculum suis]KMY23852.1 ABC transporter permease [Actinobaculum suis]MDY5153556.1 ABC transporter permease [Actinobaculum suis]OCA93069.1 ABC transporter permease [Actinobaculum suis]OCA93501.1 ABC transporter permease [Actinobaculum suis]SDE53672.1 peptide/nickel transport system permease protein [Actinobaculum suis]